MKPLIVANWKANPDSEGRAVRLVKEIEKKIVSIRGTEVVIAPPFTFLSKVSRVLNKARLGAQDTFWEDVGPYTGEISWHHLKHFGISYVIVGHSERRLYLGETDEMINKKVLALLKHGFSPVLCIGELELEGKDTLRMVGAQLKNALYGVKKNLIKRLVVAYEPVWAISTFPGSVPDTPDKAFRASIYIRKVLIEQYGRSASKEARIIYGGSVNSKNIKGFLSEGGMGGALVGGASLHVREFAQIVKIASASHLS